MGFMLFCTLNRSSQFCAGLDPGLQSHPLLEGSKCQVGHQESGLPLFNDLEDIQRLPVVLVAEGL